MSGADGDPGPDEPGSAGATWSDGVGQAMSESMEGRPDPSSIVIDTSVAHPARRYDYLLGGKTHYAADRESGDAIEAAFPHTRTSVVENRRFLRRAITVLARDHGVDQFLDIGTGIPSPGNTHEVAQAITPGARVLYADNDPVVLAQSQALLTSGPTGRTAYIQADLRDPGTILDHPQLPTTLDLTRPVGLVLVAVLHFLVEADRPYAMVERLVAAMPPGSYLVLSQVTWDYMSPSTIAKLTATMTPAAGPFQARSRQQVERFFSGLQLLPPGVGPINRWHADDEPAPRPTDEQTAFYGGIARIGADQEPA
jgi:hypothetical protein